MCFFIKLGRHVNHDEKINNFGLRGHRSKFKVTTDIYWNKLVSTIETKSLCASSSNLQTCKPWWEDELYWFWRSKVKVMMGIIDKSGMRGDATLCVVIFLSILKGPWYVLSDVLAYFLHTWNISNEESSSCSLLITISIWFRSCWNIVSKLNLAPVNFHNRKCLAMKLILYTYKFK